MMLDSLRRIHHAGSHEFVTSVFAITHILDNVVKNVDSDCVVEALESIKEQVGRGLPLNDEVYATLATHGYPAIATDMVLS